MHAPGATARKLLSNLRFASEVRQFLREHLTVEEALEIVRRRLEQRDATFLAVVKRGILDNPRSAYRTMFAEAGLDHSRLESLVSRMGVEGALEELRRRGVYVSFEEFKALGSGRQVDVEKFGRGTNFTNPAARAGLTVQSSGSTSKGTRLFMDFNSLKESAVQRLLRSAEFDSVGAERGGFLPILPAPSGLKLQLIGNYIGEPQTAWFTPVDPRRSPLVSRLATAYALGAIKLAGGTITWPRYVPLSHVEPAARWIAERRSEGIRLSFSAYASTTVRVCQAARAEGLDVSGTLFVMIGEPVTEAKIEAVRSVGGVAAISYSSVDAGQLGSTCRHSQSPDDMHLFTDSFALIRHSRIIEPFGEEVRPFLFTSLLPGSPMILVNVETDDCGDDFERSCDCIWGRLGMTRHVANVRSFAKLTAEGMTFAGSNLIHVIEKELPARFGGQFSDYQLVEEETPEGRGQLSLRVSPSVGPVDERAIVDLLYDRIRSSGGGARLFADVWREGQAITVIRKGPQSTRAGKVFPFYTLR